MNFLPILFFALQEAIKYEPQIADAIRGLLAKKDASVQDWLDAAAKYRRVEYESVVKESGLIPTPPA